MFYVEDDQCSDTSSFCAEIFMKETGMGVPNEYVAVSVSYTHLWHRMRAGPFQRTAHGESAEGLKQENTK